MNFHLLVHSNSACLCTTVWWSVTLSTKRGFLIQVDHRHCSNLRESLVLLKVFWSIFLKKQGYHSECPILLSEPFLLVDCPGLTIHFLVSSYHQESILLLLVCYCSIVGKPLCYHASDPGSIIRGSQTTRSPPRAARPTQPSIPLRLKNEYWIIPGLTPGHRRWGLLPSTITGGMTDG